MGSVKKRGNGQGSVYRRGNVWEAQVIVGWVMNPDPSKPRKPVRRRKSGFATKKEAVNYLATLREKSGGRSTDTPTLEHYWNLYKDGELTSLSKSKQTAYRTAWKKLSSISFLHVDNITVQDLRTAVSSSCKTHYPAKDCKNLLSALFKLASADGYASKDLPAYIILPPVQEVEREVFTADEQKALWKLYESGNLDAAVPLFMIYSGTMPGEMMNMKVEYIDLEKQVITGAGMKTGIRKKTPIVIADCMLPVMKDLIDNATPAGYLFPRNEPLWYERYYNVLEKAKCRKLQPYCCRHTAATSLAVTENIAPQTIKRIMRWSTTKMLDRYAHPSTEDALKGVNAIKKSDSIAHPLPTQKHESVDK